jgi:hypothetical protein
MTNLFVAVLSAAASFPLRYISSVMMAKRGLHIEKTGKPEAALVALAMGIAGAAVAAITGINLKLLYLLGLLFTGAIITEIDIKKSIIPNELSFL